MLKVLHVIILVHVPRPFPLAFGISVACHSLLVDLLALFLPPHILHLLLFRRGDVEVCAALQAFRLLSRHKAVAFEICDASEASLHTRAVKAKQ